MFAKLNHVALISIITARIDLLQSAVRSENRVEREV